MKKNILYLPALLGLFAGQTALPIFVAYQEWTNPTTGQMIHEFYDSHIPSEKTSEQQQDFVSIVNQHGSDTLVLVEDTSITPEDFASEHTQAAQKDLYFMAKEPGSPLKRISETPLRGLYSKCLTSKATIIGLDHRTPDLFWRYLRTDCQKKLLWPETVEAILANSTCKQARELSHTRKSLAKNIVDNAIKDKWFDIAREIRASEPFVYESLLFDAYTLHTVHSNPTKKHIVLATGFGHIYALNCTLPQLGFIPNPIIRAKPASEYDLHRLFGVKTIEELYCRELCYKDDLDKRKNVFLSAKEMNEAIPLDLKKVCKVSAPTQDAAATKSAAHTVLKQTKIVSKL